MAEAKNWPWSNWPCDEAVLAWASLSFIELEGERCFNRTVFSLCLHDNEYNNDVQPELGRTWRGCSGFSAYFMNIATLLLPNSEEHFLTPETAGLSAKLLTLYQIRLDTHKFLPL